MRKSELIPVGRIENMEVLVSELGYRIGRLPSTYLGLSLGNPFKLTSVWNVVEEGFQKDWPCGRGGICRKGEDLL